MKHGQHAAYCPAVTSADMHPCECGAEHEVVTEAEALGCEIVMHEFRNQPPRYYWNWGRRGSADQYNVSFTSAEEAAAHFLTTREAKNAREADARRARFASK